MKERFGDDQIKTIAEHMKDILNEYNLQYISYGDLDLIHECAERSKMANKSNSQYGNHPLNINNKILSALDRSDLFVKSYIRFNGKPARCFKLKRD